MNPQPSSILPHSRLLCWGAFLALLLLCCSAVTAAEIVRSQVTINPNLRVVTTTPTPVPTSRTVTCQAPCACMARGSAQETWGANGFVQCNELPCGYAPATAVAIPYYCFRPNQATVVPTTTAAPLNTLVQISKIPVGVHQFICPTGQALCSGACVNTSSDLKNCGSCGKACLLNQECVNGQCRELVLTAQKPADMCLILGKTSCNGACIDTQGSDSNNCGGCGWVCPSGLTCDNGECVLNCPAGQADCQYNCVDIQNDPDNCGNCGVSCSPEQTCSQGKCTSLCGINPSTLNYFSWADWQGTNWLTSVKDQGACGSCWAESTTGVTESVRNLELGYQNNLDLSEQAFVSGCNGDFGSCLGGDHTQVLASLKSSGIPEDWVLPYTSTNCVHSVPNTGDPTKSHDECNAGITVHCSIPNTCNTGTLAPDRLWKIQSYQKQTDDYAWTAQDEFHTIKQALLCHGPLDVCSGHWWHCITLVGWKGSDYDPNGGWYIKNSWGSTWNGNGYAFIPYGNPYSGDTNDAGDFVLDAWSVQGVYHVP